MLLGDNCTLRKYGHCPFDYLAAQAWDVASDAEFWYNKFTNPSDVCANILGGHFATSKGQSLAMLCDSTKNLLQTIIHSLEAQDPAAWDDQIESGKQCLYEMHQMTRPAYIGYKTSGLDKSSQFPDGARLNRAMPHVKAMVMAIRHKDRITALESGNAALAEMNGSRPAIATILEMPVAEIRVSAPPAQQRPKPALKHRPVVVKRTSAKRARAASSN